MNKLEYEQEAARQLSNTTFYRPLSSDPTEDYQKKLHHLLKKLPEKAQEQICTDTCPEPRPEAFYLLPKIHKPGNPGCPIISSIGTLTVGLSGYVDSLLRPYATSTPSYLCDTIDFLRKLQSIGDLPENTILVTMNAEALYTNFPHKDGLQALRNSVPDNVMANLVAELCDFVLTHNYFTFGYNIYLQISSTAMGTLMAPLYANIYMADLEQHFLSSRPIMPQLYLHYTDDTCTSTNVIHAIMCQQCPSATYIDQTRQSLSKRINGHKSDIRNHNIQKPVGEHFSLSNHSATDLKVAILKQKNFKNRLQRETAELE
ncbi:uncharacterized protein ACDP82_020249 isoform 1-T1 [Pangshura tecta]